MPIAEFEEKQYETQANIELGLQHSAVFAAGQVLEAVVGYDAAAQPPQNAPIWQLIGRAAPTGILLVPNLWQRARVRPQAASLPSTYVSIILQYKRPSRLLKAHATQWGQWNRPYFRFPILPHQQRTLELLQTSVGSHAVVRYACPAFWTYRELQTHQQASAVLIQSTFVAPRRLSGHQFWTYDRPGTFGRPNKRKKKGVPTEDFSGLWKQVVGGDKRKRENLFQHLRGLASELSGTAIPEDTLRSFGNLFARDNLSTDQQQAVADVLRIGSHVGEAGASWFVADLELANA